MFSSPPPQQQKMVACEVKTVLTNLIVIIISQYIVYQIIMSYTLDLPNVICQLYLSELKKKMSEKKSEMTWETEEHFQKISSLYNYHL